MIQILKYILPFILNYLDKRMPVYLEALEKIISKRIQGKINKITEDEINTQEVNIKTSQLLNRIKSVPEVETNMAAIKLNICENNVPICGVEVEFDLGGIKGKVIRYTDIYGNVSISGLTDDKVKVTAKKEGYISQIKQIELNNIDYIDTINLEKIQTLNTDKIIESITPNINEIIDEFNNFATDLSDANTKYKELEISLNLQKKEIEKALKEGAIDILKSVGTDYMYSARSQLTSSIHWYVEFRSHLSPLSSLKEFGQWCSATSAIAGLYLLRQQVITLGNKVIDKLANV